MTAGQSRKIFLTRHGESQFNMAGRIGGDSLLTPRGEEYAALLPEILESRLPAVGVYTSVEYVASFPNFAEGVICISYGFTSNPLRIPYGLVQNAKCFASKFIGEQITSGEFASGRVFFESFAQEGACRQQANAILSQGEVGESRTHVCTRPQSL